MIKKLINYYLFLIVLFFIGRLTLFIIYYERFSNENIDIWLSFLYGLKMDTIVVSMILVIPTLLITISPNKIKNFVNQFLKFYFLFFIAISIYIEVATFPFIAQFDTRPNYLFVEYLEYPKEVFSMILSKYKLELGISLFLIISFIVSYLKFYKKSNFLEIFQISYKKRAILFFPIMVTLFIGIRSSFGHRPANISDAMFSSNRILNEVTKNSIYSIGYAIYSNLKYDSKGVAKYYGKMGIEEAIKRVQLRLNIKSSNILTRFEKTNFSKKRNIVIFVQESLGYQFTQDKRDLTPNFNKLSQQGISFSNLYSNGTRSIRGLAGVTSGIFSIAGKGVLKRNKSQNNFFTIATLLKPLNYKTIFLYGGESRFDNMKGWYLGNGFDEVIDQDKIKNPQFIGTWGVSDEDLIIKANETFKNLYNQNQLFASVMFSTSNHTPFEFPQNKIELVNGVPLHSVENCVKYADYSIGKFFELAKKEKYFKDTVFLVVADHNVRVYGDDIVPVNMFHIPAFIISDNNNIIIKKPFIYRNITTQPDLLATVLDLAGISGKVPIMGKSIFNKTKQNLAFMKFNNRFALMVKDKVAILRQHKKAETFKYHKEHLIKIESDSELEKDNLAFITLLDYLYKNKLYK